MAAPRVVIPVIPILVAEADDASSQPPLVPNGAASSRTVLVPAGELIELPIRVAGKDVAMVGSWIVKPKVGRNSAVQVRARVFDDCQASTFVKPKPIEEPL